MALVILCAFITNVISAEFQPQEGSGVSTAAAIIMIMYDMIMYDAIIMIMYAKRELRYVYCCCNYNDNV